MLATREQSPEPVAQRDSGRRRAGKRRLFWPVVAAIVVGAVAIWVFAGVFLFALHIAEYVALALVAGWAGYRIGRARGRRSS
jgi:Flp pilus assembly protein TadB